MNDTKLPWADKKLGQHFLSDKKVISTICHDHHQEAEAIIEIGPGPAILTPHLTAHQLPIFVIEKDERMEEYLSSHLDKNQIIFDDALEIDLKEILKEKEFPANNIWLVSNLPYNVSVPLTIKFIQCPPIKYLSLMFQKEVAEKIVSTITGKKANNTMGSLMALTRNYFEIKTLIKVLPGAFSPPPKVDSTVLSFKRIENPTIPLSDFSSYESFLRKLFQMKRKQMGKVLKMSFEIVKVEKSLSECGLLLTSRAETLSLKEVQSLYQSLCKS